MHKDPNSQYGKFEDDPDVSQPNIEEKNINTERLDNGAMERDSKDSSVTKNPDVPVQNFDLNMELTESGDSTAITAQASSSTPAKTPVELKHEEYPGWSLAEMEQMAIDPVQLAKLNHGIDEEEEDYDEEG